MDFHPFYHEANIVRLTILIEIYEDKKKKKKCVKNPFKKRFNRKLRIRMELEFLEIKLVAYTHTHTHTLDDNIARKFVEIREGVLIEGNR